MAPFKPNPLWDGLKCKRDNSCLGLNLLFEIYFDTTSTYQRSPSKALTGLKARASLVTTDHNPGIYETALLRAAHWSAVQPLRPLRSPSHSHLDRDSALRSHPYLRIGLKRSLSWLRFHTENSSRITLVCWPRKVKRFEQFEKSQKECLKERQWSEKRSATFISLYYRRDRPKRTLKWVEEWPPGYQQWRSIALRLEKSESHEEMRMRALNVHRVTQ